MNIQLDIKQSDDAFINTDLTSFDIIILDPWTWAAKGNIIL
jgi:hypothetical protein